MAVFHVATKNRMFVFVFVFVFAGYHQPCVAGRPVPPVVTPKLASGAVTGSMSPILSSNNALICVWCCAGDVSGRPPCDWVCAVVDKLPGDSERQAALGYDDHAHLSGAWDRIVMVTGVRDGASESDITRVLSAFGAVLHAYPKVQGRLCAQPLTSASMQSRGTPNAVSSAFRTRKFTGTVPSYSGLASLPGSAGPSTPSGSLVLSVKSATSRFASKPLVHAPGTSSSAVAGVWFVEFAKPDAAAACVAALSVKSRRKTAVLTGALFATDEYDANIACKRTQCCVAAMSAYGQVLWLPVDTADVTAIDLQALLQVSRPSRLFLMSTVPRRSFIMLLVLCLPVCVDEAGLLWL